MHATFDRFLCIECPGGCGSNTFVLCVLQITSEQNVYLEWFIGPTVNWKQSTYAFHRFKLNNIFHIWNCVLIFSLNPTNTYNIIQWLIASSEMRRYTATTTSIIQREGEKKALLCKFQLGTLSRLRLFKELNQTGLTTV